MARGTVAGKEVEFSTREIDKGRAEKRAEEVLRTPRPSCPSRAGRSKDLPQAAEAYTAWRSPGWDEIRRINRLIADLGCPRYHPMTSADLVACADRLYPDHKASSRNRLVITPASPSCTMPPSRNGAPGSESAASRRPSRRRGRSGRSHGKAAAARQGHRVWPSSPSCSARGCGSPTRSRHLGAAEPGRRPDLGEDRQDRRMALEGP
jgi:hypothetical protein